MKKEQVKDLVREYLALRKKIDLLHGELVEVRDRFGKVFDLAPLRKSEDHLLEELRELRGHSERIEERLFACRPRGFIRSVISCVLDLGPEYGKDEYYHSLLTNLISIVIHFEEYEEARKSYASQDLSYLQDEEVE
jgi:predicted nuclease with TOPRIM domain